MAMFECQWYIHMCKHQRNYDYGVCVYIEHVFFSSLNPTIVVMCITVVGSFSHMITSPPHIILLRLTYSFTTIFCWVQVPPKCWIFFLRFVYSCV